jgi:hypothetical protein
MTPVSLRLLAVVVVAQLVLVQWTHALVPCCHGDECDESNHDADGLHADHGDQPPPAGSERHRDEHGSCLCLCHLSVGVPAMAAPPLAPDTASLAVDAPSRELPRGHTWSRKPPPRA